MRYATDSQISTHFTLAEVEKSETASRKNIPNRLPLQHLKNAKHLAEYILEPIRERFGAYTPNSWYRGYLLNKAVGGSKKKPAYDGRSL